MNHSWEELTKAFFCTFFLKHKTSTISRKPNNFRQQEGESLYIYLERFNNLLLQCTQNGFENLKLVQILCEGLVYPITTMITSLCSGSFTNKNVEEGFNFLK